MSSEEVEEGEITGLESVSPELKGNEVTSLSINKYADDVDANELSREKCCVCKNAPKYRCPGCELMTCSLSCCKKHKVLMSCDGCIKRSRMISLANFDNLTILNDYRFLEEADRLRKQCVTERKERQLSTFGRDRKMMSRLIKECARRRCKLQFLPPYFHKSKSNTSSFDPIADTIFWKIECIFMDAEMLKVEADRIPETVKISTFLKQIVYARRNSDYFQFAQRLKEYKSVELSNLKCFAKVENNWWTKDQRFYELNVNQSLMDNLKNRILIEFPRIFVCFSQTSMNNLRLLTDEDKNCAMSKRVWERIPTAATFDEKIKLMQDSAKSFRQPKIRNAAQNGAVSGLESAQSAESTLKPLRRLIPAKKRPFAERRTAEKIQVRKVAAETLKQEKIDAIKRLADELAGKKPKIVQQCTPSDLSNGHLADDRDEKKTETTSHNRNSNRVGSINTEPISDPSAKASREIVSQQSKTTVKTAFFGTLGDSDFSISDSDAGE